MQDETDSDDNEVGKNGRFRRRIDTAVRIRRELTGCSTTFWRTGVTPSEDAARMAVLKILHGVIVGDFVEKRLREVESYIQSRTTR